jgi:hypothetical protein
MGLAQDGLTLWKRDKRRATTQWFRKHGVTAMATVAAQRVGRRGWEGAYRTGQSAAEAMREQVQGLRKQQVRQGKTETMADGSAVRDGVGRAARSTASQSGQALAMAAVVLIDEAEAVRGATETVATLEGLRVGLDTYADAVEHLAETIRHRKGAEKAVKSVANLSGEVANLAAEAKRVHKAVADLYGSQVEQEDLTGETLT